MRLEFLSAMAVLISAAATSAASAHHSVFGVFDPEAPFSVTGIVKEVEWINPHVFLHLDVADETGAVTTWRLETVPTSALRRAGIDPEMLSGGGAPITVTGIRAHREPHTGWVHRITYADGHFYQLSNEQLDQGASRPSVPGQ